MAAFICIVIHNYIARSHQINIFFSYKVKKSNKAAGLKNVDLELQRPSCQTQCWTECPRCHEKFGMPMQFYNLIIILAVYT